MTSGSAPHGPVLVATDLKDGAAGVLPRALLLAQRWEAQVRVVYAVNDVATPGVRKAAAARLDALVDKTAFGKDVAVRSFVVDGGPEGLVREAEETGARCVLIGFHRENLAGPERLGSVMERLLRSVRADVLVTMAGKPAPYGAVLVAADGEKPLLPALAAARRYVPEGRMVVTSAVPTEAGVAPRRHALRRALWQADCTDAATFVRAGRLPEILASAAHQEDADLIVLGTRGNVMGTISPSAQAVLSERIRDTLCVHDPAAPSVV